MAFRVTGTKIAVIPIQDSDRIGLIIVPETSRQRTDQGIVAYIGPDCKDFAPGQYVVFSGHSGTMVYIADPDKPDKKPEALILIDERFVYGEIIDFEDTVVPGLYFRSNRVIRGLIDNLFDAITDYFDYPTEAQEQKIRARLFTIVVEEHKKLFIEANYETIMEFVADAVRSAKWRIFNPVTGTGIDVRAPVPDKKEYDEVMRSHKAKQEGKNTEPYTWSNSNE